MANLSYPVAWNCGVCKKRLFAYPAGRWMRCRNVACSNYAVPFSLTDRQAAPSVAGAAGDG